MLQCFMQCPGWCAFRPSGSSAHGVTQLQEEITHCAAGVRWLRYLHRLAHESPTVTASHLTVQQEAGGSAASAPGSTAIAKPAVPWMKDARQFPRVEQWFHSLVERYFKGNLKVGSSICGVIVAACSCMSCAKLSGVAALACPAALARLASCCSLHDCGAVQSWYPMQASAVHAAALQ